MRASTCQGGPFTRSKQANLILPHITVCSARHVRPVTSHRRAAERRTRRVVRVLEQSKSSAEAFIESVQQSLNDQRQEVEDSVVATDINELQQQVNELEQQVRHARGHMGCC